MIKKYIKKLINEVLDDRNKMEIAVPVSSGYHTGVYDGTRWIEERIDRLNNDIQGIANYLDVTPTYGTCFIKTKKKIK